MRTRAVSLLEVLYLTITAAALLSTTLYFASFCRTEARQFTIAHTITQLQNILHHLTAQGKQPLQLPQTQVTRQVHDPFFGFTTITEFHNNPVPLQPLLATQKFSSHISGLVPLAGVESHPPLRILTVTWRGLTHRTCTVAARRLTHSFMPRHTFTTNEFLSGLYEQHYARHNLFFKCTPHRHSPQNSTPTQMKILFTNIPAVYFPP